MAHHEESLIHAPAAPAVVHAILLDPARIPEWNPAFLALAGSEQAAVGVDYPILVRPGLRGSFRYRAIGEGRIETEWSVPGFREVAEWEIAAAGTGTIIRHRFGHSGPLAHALRHAFRGVAGLRLERLAERAAGRARYRLADLS